MIRILPALLFIVFIPLSMHSMTPPPADGSTTAPAVENRRADQRSAALPQASPAESGQAGWLPLFPEGPPGLKAGDHAETVEEGRLGNVHFPGLKLFQAGSGAGPRPAVIICPGGGYARLAVQHEGEDIARWFNAIGFHACVLKYRLKEYGHPAPIQDMQRAVRVVRANAADWGVDASRIGVFGSSAGGHMAGISATLWDHAAGRTGQPLDAVSARPDFVAMLYPVVSMDPEIAHAGSRLNLTGGDDSRELLDLLSLEQQVRPDSPPVFLVHGVDDPAVPVANSLRFGAALAAMGVAFELHAFAHGPHGFGMRAGHGPISNWPQLLADWLARQGISGPVRPPTPPTAR